MASIYSLAETQVIPVVCLNCLYQEVGWDIERRQTLICDRAVSGLNETFACRMRPGRLGIPAGLMRETNENAAKVAVATAETTSTCPRRG
jgi:hypothetical protein